MDVGAIVAQMNGGYGDHMDWNDGATWVMLTLMTIMVLAVAGGIVWAILLTTRSSAHPRSQVGPETMGTTAREVLDQRYARGEIDTADYNERRSSLE